VSIDVLPEQESVVKPGGGNVIMSASMQDTEGVNYLSFVNELIEIMKTPPPMTELVVKEHTTKDIEGNPDVFTVRITLDGQKMAGYGFGDGTDKIVVNRYVKVCRGERWVDVWEYLNNDQPDLLTSFSRTNFLEDPFRLEAFSVNHDERNGGTKDGVRCSDETAVRIWKDFFIDPICTTIKFQKVKCTPDQPSLTGSGDLVVVSDRMDEHVSIDSVTKVLISHVIENTCSVVKDSRSEDGKPDVKESDDGTTQEATLTAEWVNPPQVNADGEAAPTTKSFMEVNWSFNRTTSQFKAVTSMNGKLVRTQFATIVWPRMESYMLTAEGERRSGGSYTRDFTSFLNGLVAKGASQEGLFSGWFS